MTLDGVHIFTKYLEHKIFIKKKQLWGKILKYTFKIS